MKVINAKMCPGGVRCTCNGTRRKHKRKDIRAARRREKRRAIREGREEAQQ